MKVTYLFGAGASAAALPVVDKMPERLHEMIRGFRDPKYYSVVSELEDARAELLNHYKTLLDKLAKRVTAGNSIDWIKLHASIDTYAKKLFIRKNQFKQETEFELLKALMALFFYSEQHLKPVDIRYDAFFASILSERIDDLPKSIRILSWNYDQQLEMAFREFSDILDMGKLARHLGVFSKFTHYKLECSDAFSIFKLNGTANFLEQDKIYEMPSDMLIGNSVLTAYKKWKTKELEAGISFAWEKEITVNKKEANSIVDKAIAAISNTEILVVIGYSFPLFNRRIDKDILESLERLRKIYIQDLKPKTIRDRILSFAELPATVEFELSKDRDQFLIPSELDT